MDCATIARMNPDIGPEKVVRPLSQHPDHPTGHNLKYKRPLKFYLQRPLYYSLITAHAD